MFSNKALVVAGLNANVYTAARQGAAGLRSFNDRRAACREVGYFGKKLGTDLMRGDQGGFDKTSEIMGEYQVNRFIEDCRMNVAFR